MGHFKKPWRVRAHFWHFFDFIIFYSWQHFPNQNLMEISNRKAKMQNRVKGVRKARASAHPPPYAIAMKQVLPEEHLGEWLPIDDQVTMPHCHVQIERNCGACQRCDSAPPFWGLLFTYEVHSRSFETFLWELLLIDLGIWNLYTTLLCVCLIYVPILVIMGWTIESLQYSEDYKFLLLVTAD